MVVYGVLWLIVVIRQSADEPVGAPEEDYCAGRGLCTKLSRLRLGTLPISEWRDPLFRTTPPRRPDAGCRRL